MLVRQRVLVAPVILMSASLAFGCATKTFVREEVAKSDQRLSQEVGRLDRALAQEQAQVSGLAVQVAETRLVADQATRRSIEALGVADQASGRANEAVDRAAQALTKAEEASGTASQAVAQAEQADQRLTRLWGNRQQLQPGETVVVSFGFDRWTLDDRAETALLEAAKGLQEHPNRVVQLEGYTDNAGSRSYNIELSQRRAEAVRRFLVANGIELHRIQSIGLGDVHPVADNKTKQGRDRNRRVTVTLLAPAD